MQSQNAQAPVNIDSIREKRQDLTSRVPPHAVIQDDRISFRPKRLAGYATVVLSTGLGDAGNGRVATLLNRVSGGTPEANPESTSSTYRGQRHAIVLLLTSQV